MFEAEKYLSVMSLFVHMQNNHPNLLAIKITSSPLDGFPIVQIEGEDSEWFQMNTWEEVNAFRNGVVYSEDHLMDDDELTILEDREEFFIRKHSEEDPGFIKWIDFSQADDEICSKRSFYHTKRLAECFIAGAKCL